MQIIKINQYKILSLCGSLCACSETCATVLFAVDYQSIGLYSCIAHFTREPIQTVLYSIDRIVSGSLATQQHSGISFPSHNKLSFSGWNELNRLCIQSRKLQLQNNNNDGPIVIGIIPQRYCSCRTIMNSGGLQKAWLI